MQIQQNAYVLHSRPYKETSALVTFLTEDYGKINAVVRGVRGGRKPSAQKMAMLQPFQQVMIQWRERNQASDLFSIQELEMAALRFPLQGEANICGLYLNELLYRLLFPQVAIEGLVDDYQQALYQLSRTLQREQQAWALRQFEYQLLQYMGEGLQCELDYYQQPIDEDSEYFYYPQQGAILASQDKLRNGIALQGKCLLALARMQYEPDCLSSLKRLFRQVLALYLGNKPIMARELFAKGR